jgi:hypothetical protein
MSGIKRKTKKKGRPSNQPATVTARDPKRRMRLRCQDFIRPSSLDRKKIPLWVYTDGQILT